VSATAGDRHAARELVVGSIEGHTRASIEGLLERAEAAPAFALPLRVLAGVASEVLDAADREGVPHAGALQTFALRIYSRRSAECALVDRVLAAELHQARRRRIVEGSG
jgi:hypothetical protein